MNIQKYVNYAFYIQILQLTIPQAVRSRRVAEEPQSLQNS